MAILTRRPQNTQSLSRARTQGQATTVQIAQEVANAEAVKALLAYLKHLHSEGEITDEAHKILSREALNGFVRNSIYFRVEHLFEDLDTALEEVSEVIHSNVFK